MNVSELQKQAAGRELGKVHFIADGDHAVCGQTYPKLWHTNLTLFMALPVRDKCVRCLYRRRHAPREVRVSNLCARCGHDGQEHGRECDMTVTAESKRELCLLCPGYMIEIGGIEVDGYPHGKAWHRFREAS